MKAKKSNLNKGNRESAFVSKRPCNIEICTLNQNPAEIIIDDGKIIDGPTNLKQRSAEDSMQAKKSNLNKGNRESAFVSKRPCNIEICTLSGS